MAIFKHDSSAFEPQKLHRTPEGYLTGRIRVTCAGVFRYLSSDGKTVVRVLRPESEVGDLASVMSANSKPVTLQHPDDMVNAGNVKKYEVGFTGTDAEFDGIDLWLTITVTDQKAVEAIESGEVKAVSMGYDVQSVEENADPLNNWRGTEYTHVQHGIRYNHLALVYAGRAGESVAIAVGDSMEGLFNINKTGGTPAKDSAMKKIIIDGAVYECDEAVAAKVAGLEKQLADSASAHKAELDKVTAERDAALAEAKTLKETQKDESAIAKMVDEKIALVEKAKGYGCEVKTEDSALDIKKAVIAKAFGDKMDLTDKSADYVGVAFDSACIHLDSVEDTAKKDKSPFAGDYKNLNDNMDCDPEKAYRAMCDAMKGKSAKKGA